MLYLHLRFSLIIKQVSNVSYRMPRFVVVTGASKHWEESAIIGKEFDILPAVFQILWLNEIKLDIKSTDNPLGRPPCPCPCP